MSAPCMCPGDRSAAEQLCPPLQTLWTIRPMVESSRAMGLARPGGWDDVNTSDDGSVDRLETGPGTTASRPDRPLISRRDALRSGLLVGATAWTVPLAQAATATRAAAETPSAPRPVPPGGGVGEAQVPAATAGRRLAATGGDATDLAVLTAAGTGAVLAGAAVVRRHGARRDPARHRD